MVLVPAFVLSGLVVFELVYEDPCWSGSHICGLLWLKLIFFFSTSLAKSSLSASQCKHLLSVSETA